MTVRGWRERCCQPVALSGRCCRVRVERPQIRGFVSRAATVTASRIQGFVWSSGVRRLKSLVNTTLTAFRDGLMTSHRKTSESWYGDGLRFQCTQCGNCCTGSPGFVWVDDEEIAEIARHLGRSIGEIRLMQTRIARGRVSLRDHANGDCVFLDPQTPLCSIYDARPKQCRSWPFWKSNIASPEAWEQTQEVCPGSGQGGFVSAAELERSANLIEL